MGNLLGFVCLQEKSSITPKSVALLENENGRTQKAGCKIWKASFDVESKRVHVYFI